MSVSGSGSSTPLCVVDDDQEFIEFMLQGRHCRLTRERLAALLGVTHSAEPHSLHHLTYSDVEPPRRPHQPYPPADEEASRLFVQPFLPGTPRVPDRLTPLAKTVHLALRRSLLYRMGYNEGITALQQWLLIHILTGIQFNIVDLFICELEEVIYDGMTAHRQQPFAH